jgi:hypothetical protein
VPDRPQEASLKLWPISRADRGDRNCSPPLPSGKTGRNAPASTYTRKGVNTAQPHHRSKIRAHFIPVDERHGPRAR